MGRIGILALVALVTLTGCLEGWPGWQERETERHGAGAPDDASVIIVVPAN